MTSARLDARTMIRTRPLAALIIGAYVRGLSDSDIEVGKWTDDKWRADALAKAPAVRQIESQEVLRFPTGWATRRAWPLDRIPRLDDDVAGMWSPDGKWWWDGTTWLPAEQAPSPVSPVPGQAGPRQVGIRSVPGFRSGIVWKILLAIVGYAVILLFMVGSLATAWWGGVLFGVGVLLVVVLAANGWGLRTRLPMFGSDSRGAAGIAWVVLILLVVGSTAVALPPTRPANLTASAVATPTPIQETFPSPRPSPKAAPPAPKPSPKPSPKPTPTPSPVASPSPAAPASPSPPPPPPPPPPDTCGAPSNPWGYNFCSGNLIYSPDPGFCGVFSCIGTFDNGKGYVVQCVDGMFSKSGGRSGVCSYHGGYQRDLYGP